MNATAGTGLPHWLSADERKRRLYPDDIYFREAWADALDILGDPRPLLERTTFMLFKPEAIVGRRADPAVGFLRARGFEALASRTLRCDRHVVRALWRYQLNAAPLATLKAVDMITASSEFLLVVLRDQPGPIQTPAATRLSADKGSSRRREHGRLRDLLRSPTLLLNFVHAPDDPADLVRELGVLLSDGEREMLLRSLPPAHAEGHRIDLDAVLQAVYAGSPAHHLDVGRSLAALHAIAAHDRAHASTVDAVLGAVARPAEDLELLALVRWLDMAEIDLPRWDRLVICAHLVGRQRPERAPLVG